MTTKIIEVTDQDIVNGVRGHVLRCPIALALQRKLPDSDIQVDYFYITVDGKRYLTSHDIQNFIKDFDEGEPVGRLSLILDDEAQRAW